MNKFTDIQKTAIINYLTVSITHTKAEAVQDELLDMPNNFKAIAEMQKCLDAKDIDFIIINRDECAKLLGVI